MFQKYADDIVEVPEALAGGMVLLPELLLKTSKCTGLHGVANRKAFCTPCRSGIDILAIQI